MLDAFFAHRIAIEETKARYCRCLDTKDWSGFAAVFTQDYVLDATDSGGPVVHGRDQAVEMTRRSVGDAITVHQVHSPEIDLSSDDTARVIWAMQDRIVWSSERAHQIGYRSMTGWGHYHETYVRQPDGAWLIAAVKLTRLHMEMQPTEQPA